MNRINRRVIIVMLLIVALLIVWQVFGRLGIRPASVNRRARDLMDACFKTAPCSVLIFAHAHFDEPNFPLRCRRGRLPHEPSADREGR